MYLSLENNSTPAIPCHPEEEYVGGHASYFETYFAGIVMLLFCLIILCLQILKRKKLADEDWSSTPTPLPDEAGADLKKNHLTV